ncbi:hypothetical protein DUZ99_11945 [Xylanibacillus composti]|uniref:Uncharacterized protein n=1 Tax=Xylanibacillus composti TaxID=1572762 RepID=A0A8J4H5G6_9BACL|nr:hypothetical protein [Xylanibacillus composti]MDT9725685.1 hypothetical protein [Xylanibacillus composti]GIQ71174.1 hypothetical protein XYCOK13_39980 [Xylanibacillus composti]
MKLDCTLILIYKVPNIAIKLEKDTQKRVRSELTVPAIAAVLPLILFAVRGFILSYNLGYVISVAAFAALAVGVVFIFVGNLVPSLLQGSHTWPKLPEQVQRKLARFQGRLVFVLGILFVLLAFLPSPIIFPAFFVLFVGFLLISLRQWMRYARTASE